MHKTGHSRALNGTLSSFVGQLLKVQQIISKVKRAVLLSYSDFELALKFIIILHERLQHIWLYELPELATTPVLPSLSDERQTCRISLNFPRIDKRHKKDHL